MPSFKGVLCVVLSGLVLLLTGCRRPAVSGSPSSALPCGPGVQSSPLLEKMQAVLTQDGVLAQIRLLPVEYYPGKRVQVSRELLHQLAVALQYSEPDWEEQELDELPVPPTPAGSFPKGHVFMEITVPGDQLYLMFAMQKGKCTGALSIGEEKLLLTYPPQLYGYVLTLIEGNLVEDTVVLTGDTVQLAQPQAAQKEPFTSTQWMETSGGLAGLFTWQQAEGYRSALELFDAKTGESLYYKEIGAQALRMEPASFASCDVRVLMADGAMWYLRSENPDIKPYYFYLPKALRNRLLAPLPQDAPAFRSYDGGTGQGAVWVVADEAGIAWARRSKGGSIENEVILEHMPPEWLPQSGPLPTFDQVHLMDGGSVIVATVVNPGGQLGEIGLFVHNIGTGKSQWYFGMFSLPYADLRFLDDTHVAVAGEQEIYLLNVATGQESSRPAPPDIAYSHTSDYQHYVFTGKRLQPDGSVATVLYTDDASQPFLMAVGGDNALLVQGITPTYVVLTLREPEGDSWRVARWPRTGG